MSASMKKYIGRTVGIAGQSGEFVITSIGKSVGLHRAGRPRSAMNVDRSDILGVALPKFKFGVENPAHGVNLPPMTDAEILERLEYYSNCGSAVKTGRHYGVSDKAVIRWRDKHAPAGLHKAIDDLRAKLGKRATTRGKSKLAPAEIERRLTALVDCKSVRRAANACGITYDAMKAFKHDYAPCGAKLALQEHKQVVS